MPHDPLPTADMSLHAEILVLRVVVAYLLSERMNPRLDLHITQLPYDVTNRLNEVVATAGNMAPGVAEPVAALVDCVNLYSLEHLVRGSRSA